jgi:predicted Fe-Mo cluster-binding NifX family protein
MFSFEALLDQAKNLFSGEIAEQAAEFADPSQMLSDAGVDLEALGNLGPEEAMAFLEKAGVDPSILENVQLDEITSGLMNGDKR